MLHIKAAGHSWPIRNLDAERVRLQLFYIASLYSCDVQIFDDRTGETVFEQTGTQPDPRIVSANAAANVGMHVALGAKEPPAGKQAAPGNAAQSRGE